MSESTTNRINELGAASPEDITTYGAENLGAAGPGRVPDVEGHLGAARPAQFSRSGAENLGAASPSEFPDVEGHMFLGPDAGNPKPDDAGGEGFAAG